MYFLFTNQENIKIPTKNKIFYKTNVMEKNILKIVSIFQTSEGGNMVTLEKYENYKKKNLQLLMHPFGGIIIKDLEDQTYKILLNFKKIMNKNLF